MFKITITMPTIWAVNLLLWIICFSAKAFSGTLTIFETVLFAECILLSVSILLIFTNKKEVY